MEIDIQELKNKISESQHCQRNWDLTNLIPQEHIDIFVHAVTQCPSKQNISHYSVKFITNREIIEQIYNNTWVPIASNSTQRSRGNPQVLANLLVLFERKSLDRLDGVAGERTYDIDDNNEFGFDVNEIHARDSITSIGIAAGYLNLIAHQLGYKTGFCACFNTEQIEKILKTDHDPMLFLGIGHSNDNVDWRIDHQTTRKILSFSKQTIECSFI